MTTQPADQQPAPRRGLLVIYSAPMLAILLGDDADRNLISAASASADP